VNYSSFKSKSDFPEFFLEQDGSESLEEVASMFPAKDQVSQSFSATHYS
jgi:hypothetical protein